MCCVLFNPNYYGNIMGAHWIITFPMKSHFKKVFLRQLITKPHSSKARHGESWKKWLESLYSDSAKCYHAPPVDYPACPSAVQLLNWPTTWPLEYSTTWLLEYSRRLKIRLLIPLLTLCTQHVKSKYSKTNTNMSHQDVFNCPAMRIAPVPV